MQFLFPGFLWALLALLVPVLIHLFYFRRFKKVYFTNVQFLKEIKEETSARSKLRNWLVLLARLLALAFLVFAFAQPIVTNNIIIDERPNLVSIFVDNSFSMQALSEDVALLTKAKDQAKKIINAYGEQDQYQILTHALTGKEQRLLSKEEALTAVNAITSSAKISKLQKVINRQNQLADQRYQSKRYILSDFQKNISQFDISRDSSVSSYLIPLQAVQESNVSIDSVWSDAPVIMYNQPNRFVVSIENHGDQAVESIPLSVSYAGQKRPLGRFNIDARSKVIDTVDLSISQTGWQEATFSITDYPIEYDDIYHIAFDVAENVKVLSINQNRSNTYLSAVFKGLPFFDLTNQTTNQLQYSKFSDYNLIIINDLINLSSGLISTLSTYVNEGGNLLIFTSPALNKSNYNQLLGNLRCDVLTDIQKDGPYQSSQLNKADFVFSNVYEGSNRDIKLPVSSSRWLTSNYQNRGEQRLISFRDGKALLSKYTKDAGHVYLSSIPLDPEISDISKNAEIFVPMLYKMALSQAEQSQLSYLVGKDQIIESDEVSNSSENIFKMTGNIEFIPSVSKVGSRTLLNMQDQIKESGVFELSEDDKLLSKLAYNYDRLESSLDHFTVDELNNLYADKAEIIESGDGSTLSEYIAVQSQGRPLWKWCILLVLLFLIIETLVLRFWKI